MNIQMMLLTVLVMATVTYLPRVIPLVLFRRKVKNRFIKSLLTYLPYGMLAAMVVPSFLFGTASIYSALAGGIVAVILSLRGRSLFPVAVSATLTVFIVEQIMVLAGGIA